MVILLLLLLAIRFIQIHRYKLRPDSRIGHFTVRPKITRRILIQIPAKASNTTKQQNPNPKEFLFFIPIEADLTVSIKKLDSAKSNPRE
jgi:hypothetical protein